MTDDSLPAEISASTARGAAPHDGEALFRTLVEISTDCITIVDRDGILRYASPAIEVLIGYAPDELAGQAFAQFLHTDDLPRVARSFAEQFDHPEQPIRVEARVRHKDGSWRSTESVSKLMPDGNVVAYTRDIGERHEADQALRAVAEGTAGVTGDDFFRSLVKHLASALGARYAFVAECLGTSPTKAHILAFWNGAAFGPDSRYELAGTPCEGVVAGQPCLYPQNLQAFFPQNQALTRMDLQSYLGVPIFNAVGQVLGHLVVMDERPMHDDPRRTTILTIFAARAGAELERQRAEMKLLQLNEELEDRVAERTAALEAALAESRRLAAIIEAMPDYIGMTDVQGYSLYVNSAGKRMVGKADADYPKRWHVSGCYPQWEQARFGEVFEVVNRTGVWSGEFDVLHKDGHTFPSDHSVFALRDPSGKIESYAAIIRDISERKRVEAELQQAKEAAEAAAHAKSIFLANMSHEIRTPMNAVIGMTGLLLNTQLDEKQRDFVEIIRGAGDSLLMIINDILDFSKIEAGKLTLERQSFDLRQCIESALDLLAPRAAEKGLDLAYAVDERTPAAIVGDVTRLRQILVNLLSNAIKFTEQGEVVISVGLEARGLGLESENTTSLKPQVSSLIFSVKDTGIGIPPDKLDRLFQSFTQIDASTTRQYGGTGLGLAISKRLAELMGGTMWAESAGIPGHGATFHFTLQATAAPAPVRVYLRGRRPELSGKRILVVDDHPTNRRIISLQTQTWGMVPTEAATPSEALALIRCSDPFDLAILDMQLPEMDGAALAAEICALDLSPRLPLIMLTSLGHDPHPDLESVACFVAYLTKPVKPSQLYDVIIGALTTLPGQPEANKKAELFEPQGHTAAALVHTALAPLRILLAEDVVVNQKFALLALEEMGYTADIAANGQEALTAVQRQPYDVILMDVQMPVMDGLEATRRVRALPLLQPYIIAMTANAMQGDREVCLEVGMDDYISKPVYPEELRMALERAAEHRSASPADEHGRSSAPLDQAVIAQLLARSRGRELLALYAEESREIVGRLREAVAHRDVTAIRETAHSLKGSSQYVGASQVAALSAALEQHARTGTLTDIDTLVAALESQFARVTRAIVDLSPLAHPQ